MTESHEIMGGKVRVFRRKASNYWQCYTFMNGRIWRESTKEDSLARAKDFAEDWFITLKGKSRAGELKNGKLIPARCAELSVPNETAPLERPARPVGTGRIRSGPHRRRCRGRRSARTHTNGDRRLRRPQPRR